MIIFGANHIAGGLLLTCDSYMYIVDRAGGMQWHLLRNHQAWLQGSLDLWMNWPDYKMKHLSDWDDDATSS